MDDGGQGLDPVDQPGAGADEGGVGVHRPHRDAVREVSAVDQLHGQGHRPLETEAARGHHDHFGPAPRRRRPSAPGSIGSRIAPAPTRPPAASTMSGTQWPEEKGGSVHSSTATRGRGRPATAVATIGQPPTEAGHELVGGPLAAGGPAHRPDRVEHLVQGHRVEGQHLGPAAEVGQGVVDLGAVDGTDGAEVLGHHQVGVEASGAAPRRGCRGPRRRPAGPAPRRRSAPGSGRRAARWWTRWSGAGPPRGSRTRRSRRRTSSPAPTAKRISVAEGSSETMRTQATVATVRRGPGHRASGSGPVPVDTRRFGQVVQSTPPSMTTRGSSVSTNSRWSVSRNLGRSSNMAGESTSLMWAK